MTTAESQTKPASRRMVSFDELEAWLRELPWWREWVREAGDRPVYHPDGSPIEGEAGDVFTRIRGKVQLLDAWVGIMTPTGTFTSPPKLPEDLAKLLQYRYMTKTVAMGLPVADVVMALRISTGTFYSYRARALELVATAVYVSAIDVGEPYSDCRDAIVPREIQRARKADRRSLIIRRRHG